LKAAINLYFLGLNASRMALPSAESLNFGLRGGIEPDVISEKISLETLVISAGLLRFADPKPGPPGEWQPAQFFFTSANASGFGCAVGATVGKDVGNTEGTAVGKAVGLTVGFGAAFVSKAASTSPESFTLSSAEAEDWSALTEVPRLMSWVAD
jgi:hypothetical protein